jgi:hypothetical protein
MTLEGDVDGAHPCSTIPSIETRFITIARSTASAQFIENFVGQLTND